MITEYDTISHQMQAGGGRQAEGSVTANGANLASSPLHATTHAPPPPALATRPVGSGGGGAPPMPQKAPKAAPWSNTAESLRAIRGPAYCDGPGVETSSTESLRANRGPAKHSAAPATSLPWAAGGMCA